MCRAPTIHRNITMKGNRSSDQLNTDTGNRPQPRTEGGSMCPSIRSVSIGSSVEPRLFWD